MPSEFRRPDGRLHLWVALGALAVAISLMFLASAPEPCTDQTTTVCAP